jgi:ATP-dependent DNA helicase PIF1
LCACRSLAAQSLLLRHARATLLAQGKRLELTGATGLVASALGGRTLHSWAGVQLGKGSKEALLELVRKDVHALKRWQQVDVLFIDEISFIDGRLFKALEHIASQVRSRPRFGGIQLVLSGDFLQLPPVHHGSEPPCSFAFECDVWRQCVDAIAELGIVHRQHSDPGFVRYTATVLSNTSSRRSSPVVTDCFLCLEPACWPAFGWHA